MTRDVSSAAAITLLLYAAFIGARHVLTVHPPRRHIVLMLAAAVLTIVSQLLVLLHAFDTSQIVRVLPTVAFALAIVSASRE